MLIVYQASQTKLRQWDWSRLRLEEEMEEAISYFLNELQIDS